MTKEQTELAQQASAQVKLIANAAKAAFVQRDELIDALVAAMLSGQHAIALGPPGTGKSQLIRYFAEAADLRFFRRLLNPDTPREDLVGPIDPVALGQGIWDRRWAGLATCDVAFLDEIGKASPQVQNILLDAMEERKVSSGDLDQDIPLHLVLSASNETIDDNPAIWDRFTIRLKVAEIADVAGFSSLLQDAWTTDSPPSHPISSEMLVAARSECKRMAAAAGADPKIATVMVKLWDRVRQATANKPSGRRWLRLLVVDTMIEQHMLEL